MNASYSPEECVLFADALDAAWKHLAETNQACDESLTKAALSRAILQAAVHGERTPAVLVAFALAHLERAKVEIRGGIDPSVGRQPAA